MARGTHTVTRALAKAGHPEVTMYRGEGYHYFTFDALDEHNVYEEQSEYCPRFNDLTHERWIDIGTTFAERIKREKAL